MEYNFWKTVLLDWVNSTGFLVQNYENLGDTNIEIFFEAFKKQIKSTTIKSKNVISFVEEYYKDFYLKLDGKHMLPSNEYVYIYSLFLHFSCVLHADMGIQHICNNMVRKNQESIEKFLDYLFKIGRCERAIVQTAIEEAENCDYGMSEQSPIARVNNIQSLMSSISPQTPKSRMLNSWNVENRNLKAQLETERFERGYLEMQLNQCEKKLAKMDDDYKEALIQNNYLKKQIQSLDEHDQLSQIAQNDVTVRQLRREIEEKEQELLNLTIVYNESKSDVETLNEKLQYAESQVKTLNTKLLESFSEAEAFKSQLDEREKMINYMNNNIKELSDLLKELQSNSKKQDLDSSSSCEIFSSTANDLNVSNFLEENLASAVVDIRLLDQQKQNLALNESLSRVQNELSSVHEEMIRFYKNVVASHDDVESSSPNAMLSQINEKYAEMSEKNQTLLNDIERQSAEITSMQQQIVGLQTNLGEYSKNNEILQNKLVDEAKAMDGIQIKLSLIQDEASQLYKNVITTNDDVEPPSPMKLFSHLNQKYIELTNMNQNLTTEIDKQSQEIVSLQNRNVELNASLDEYSKSNIVLQESLNKLNDENTALNGRQSELNEKYSEMIEKNQILSNQIEGQLLEIASLQQQIVELNTNLDERSKQNVILQESLDQSKEENKALNGVLSELTTVKDKAIDLYRTAVSPDVEPPLPNVIFSQLNEKYAEMTGKNQSLLNEIESQSSEIASMRQQIVGLQTNLEEYTKNNDSLQNKLKEENDALDSVQRELATVREEAIRLYKNVVTTNDDVDSSSPNAVFSCLSEKYAEMVDINQNLTKEIENQSSKAASMEQQISDLNNNLDERSKKNEILQESLDKLEEQNKALNGVQIELNSIEEEVSQLYKNMVTSDDSIEPLSLHAMLSQLIEKCADMTEKNHSLSNEIERQTFEFTSMQEQTTGLNAKLKEYSKNNETLQESLSKLTEENNALNGLHTELNDKYAKMSEANQSQSIEIENQSKEIASKQQKIEELNANIEEHIKNNEALQNKLKDENKALIAVQSELSVIQGEAIQLYKNVVNSGDNIESPSPSEVFSYFNEKYAEVVDTKQKQTNEIENQSQEITSMQQQIVELNAKLDEYSKNNAALQESLNKLTDEHEALNGLHTELNEKYAKMVETNQNQSTEIENQTKDIALKQHQIDELNTNIEEHTKNIETLRESLDKLQDENKALNGVQSELSNIQVEAIKLYKNMVKPSDDVELPSSISMINSFNDKYTEIIETNQNLSGEIEKQSKEIASKQKQVDELNTNLIESTKNNETLQESLSKLTEQNKALESVEKELTNIQEEVIRMYKNVAASNESVDLPSPNAILSQLNEKYTEMVDINQKQASEVTSMQNQIVELNAKLDEYSKNNAALQESLNQLTEENKALNDVQMDMKEKYTEKMEKGQILSEKVESQSSEIKSMQQKIVELSEKLDERSQKNEILQAALNKLKDENKLLVESSTSKEQLIALNEQLVAMEKINNEKFELYKKEKENLIQDVKICRAKLMKEREASEQKEKEFKEMRNNCEERLEKMKDKMKSLYKMEMAKVQDKHIEQLNDVHNENRRQMSDKLGLYENKIKEFSMQIHSLNEEKLLLLKEHEIMKAKLRTFEIDSTLNRGNGTNSSAMFFDKIRAKNFRMEDEEGELFDNTYLDELKKGPGQGRESLTLDEIQRRNSMVPPHLRSSYMPQFYNDEPKTNQENFKSLNDSMFSNASEMRRGTAYKRPGPPTPSKNGGRFSLGGGNMDLPRGDILREQNGATERPSIGGGTSKAAKKNTPGKFSRLFSTTKLKDEDKENNRNNLEHLQKMFFSTSTPRRRPARHSSLPKFETTELLGLMNNSLSTIETRCMTDAKRLGTLTRNMALQTRRISRKIFTSAGKNPTNTDSTPEYEPVHGDCTKLMTTPRKSFIKKRSALLKKKATQNRAQREKRFAIYNQRRRMSEFELTVDETGKTGKTYSIGSTAKISAATYDIMADENDNDVHNLSYESEIYGFQKEVNQCEGPIEIIVDHFNDEVDFEKLCNVKQSVCPFEGDKVKLGQTVTVSKLSNDEKCTSSSNAEQCGLNFSPQLMNLNVSGTRMSSHCGRAFWNPAKIPTIAKFKAEKKSFDNESQHSSGSNQSSQTHLISTMKSFQSNVTIGWQCTPGIIRYYLIAITFGFFAILYHVLFR